MRRLLLLAFVPAFLLALASPARAESSATSLSLDKTASPISPYSEWPCEWSPDGCGPDDQPLPPVPSVSVSGLLVCPYDNFSGAAAVVFSQDGVDYPQITSPALGFGEIECFDGARGAGSTLAVRWAFYGAGLHSGKATISVRIVSNVFGAPNFDVSVTQRVRIPKN
jgi:hypothetical protein